MKLRDIILFTLALSAMVYMQRPHADDYLNWNGVSSAKLQRATGREKRLMGQFAMDGRKTFCMDYGATQDCDLAVTNKAQVCMSETITEADGESWRYVVCHPRGPVSKVTAREGKHCADNPACGAVQ